MNRGLGLGNVTQSHSGPPFCLFFLKIILFGLGLHCCAWAFSGCSEQGLLSAAVLRLLSGVAPLGAEHRPGVRGLRGCSTWAELPCSMWNPPGPGIKPVSPALADGFLSISWNTRRVQWISLRGTRKGGTPRTRSLRPLMSITYEWYLCLPCLLLRKEAGQDWSMVPLRMTGAHSRLSSCPLQPSEGMALRHQQHGASILSWLSWVPICLSWSQVQVYSLASPSKVQEKKTTSVKLE